MKKTAIALLTLAAGILALSCQKEAEPGIKPFEPMTINAVSEGIGTATKTEMAYKYDILWSEDDQIYVTDGVSNDTFTLSDGAGTTKGIFTQDGSASFTGKVQAYYPENLVASGKPVWPALQVNKQTVPMYASKTVSGKVEDFNFASLGSVLHIVLSTSASDITISKIKISDASKAMSGAFTVDEDGKAVMDSEAEGGIELNVGETSIGGAAKYFNIAVPSAKYENVKLDFYTNDGRASTMKSTTLPEIEHNTVAKIALCLTKFRTIPKSVKLSESSRTLKVGRNFTLTTTITPGNADNKNIIWSSSDTDVATVSSDGKVTAVTKGTATITATTEDEGHTASCTVSVYDLPKGVLPGKFSVSANKKVHFSQGNLWVNLMEDLFFEDAQWKSTPTAEGKYDAMHVSHFTWSDEIRSATGDSNKGDFLFCDEQHKQSVNKGDKIFYALSKDEWQYLFNSRTMDNGGPRYEIVISSGVTIGTVVFKGIVLFPDNFTDQENWKTKYSGWTWEDFNDLGLVFLPAAGERNGDVVKYIGQFGYYWSSSPYPEEMAENYAWRLGFKSDRANPDSQSDRFYGYCIRLVADVTE